MVSPPVLAAELTAITSEPAANVLVAAKELEPADVKVEPVTALVTPIP